MLSVQQPKAQADSSRFRGFCCWQVPDYVLVGPDLAWKGEALTLAVGGILLFESGDCASRSLQRCI
jgi:hypothetical protein